jgi:hypothetical protein
MAQDGSPAKKNQTYVVAYRVGQKAHDEIESRAALAGKSPNDWCRDELLARLNEGGKLTANEELIHSEIIRYGNVLTTFLDLALKNEVTVAMAAELKNHLVKEQKELYQWYFAQASKAAGEEG